MRQADLSPLAVALGLCLVNLGSAAAAPRIGEKAPAFVGATIDGQVLDLSAFRGALVIVNVWATWCPPCRAEMPMLDAFAKSHAAENVVIVGLSADRRRDLADVRQAMAPFSYKAALLSEAKVNAFGAPAALPETLIIDPEGVVRTILINEDKPLTAEALTSAVAAVQAKVK